MFGRRRREGDCERDEAERCWGVVDVHLSSATYLFIYFRRKKKKEEKGAGGGEGCADEVADYFLCSFMPLFVVFFHLQPLLFSHVRRICRCVGGGQKKKKEKKNDF
ncbi:kasal-type serpin,serine protease inhibitor [Trypanosoma cruzi cruzi]|nr:kasal-type serpin,serine protease inhibitor [Trypanosoma cruzi cruzi]